MDQVVPKQTPAKPGDETSVSDLALGADPGGSRGYPPVQVTNGRALNGGLAIPDSGHPYHLCRNVQAPGKHIAGNGPGLSNELKPMSSPTVTYPMLRNTGYGCHQTI